MATTLQKQNNRLSDPGKKREIFAEALSKLWDIEASDVIQMIQKNKMLSKERKDEDIFFMKTSGMQEKVSLEGKMHCIRKGSFRVKRLEIQKCSSLTPSKFAQNFVYHN